VYSKSLGLSFEALGEHGCVPEDSVLVQDPERTMLIQVPPGPWQPAPK
jgi:hypothetical protein